jgi:pimeloyl-ACP methyl ester carboxylesterase
MLAYSECGDPRGRPLVFLHGFPGSRARPPVCLTRRRVREVHVCSPGAARDRALPHHSPAVRCSTTRKTSGLAEQLGVSRFTVLGESGGGPFALACAHEVPDRVDGVAVVCGLGPIAGLRCHRGIAIKERIGYALAARMPLLAGRALLPIADGPAGGRASSCTSPAGSSARRTGMRCGDCSAISWRPISPKHLPRRPRRRAGPRSSVPAMAVRGECNPRPRGLLPW